MADSFDADRKGLSSLEGAPAHIRGSLYCSGNELTSLEGVPARIDGYFHCTNNKLTSLKDIHLQIKHIGRGVYFERNSIKSHVLGLLLIDGIKMARIGYSKVDDILNRHIPSKGMESVLEAQDELILAGLEEYAQL